MPSGALHPYALAALVVPQHLAVPAGAGQHAGQYEQQVGKTIEVADRFGSHRIVARQGDGFALGAAFGGVIFGVLTYYFYSRFNLSHERHAQIMAELTRRRAAQAPAPSPPLLGGEELGQVLG